MYETVLVPVDGSRGARRAARHAIAIAERFDASIHALYVVDVTALDVSAPDLDLGRVRDALESHGAEAVAAVADLAAESGVPCTTAVAEGVTDEAILDYADEHGADLIVMGTHGRTGFDRWLVGSVAERVVRRADVPVMTVHLAGEDG